MTLMALVQKMYEIKIRIRSAMHRNTIYENGKNKSFKQMIYVFFQG